MKEQILAEICSTEKKIKELEDYISQLNTALRVFELLPVHISSPKNNIPNNVPSKENIANKVAGAFTPNQWVNARFDKELVILALQESGQPMTTSDLMNAMAIEFPAAKGTKDRMKYYSNFQFRLVKMARAGLLVKAPGKMGFQLPKPKETNGTFKSFEQVQVKCNKPKIKITIIGLIGDQMQNLAQKVKAIEGLKFEPSFAFVDASKPKSGLNGDYVMCLTEKCGHLWTDRIKEWGSRGILVRGHITNLVEEIKKLLNDPKTSVAQITSYAT